VASRFANMRVPFGQKKVLVAQPNPTDENLEVASQCDLRPANTAPGDLAKGRVSHMCLTIERIKAD
jgi:hypothetical protein